MQHPEAREKAAAAAIARADFERLPEAVRAKALAAAEYRQQTMGGKGGSTEDPEEPPRASGSATGSGGKGGGTEDPKGRSDHVVGRSEGGSKQKWCDYPIDLEVDAEVDVKADSSDDGMMTTKDVSEGSSRMSKSRLSATRGPKRANKRREENLAYAKAKAIEEGREWKETTSHEEWREKKRLVWLPEDVRNEVEKDAIDKILETMTEMGYTREEFLRFFFDCSEFFAPRWIKTPPWDLEQQAEQRYIVMREGWKYCLLCDKWGTDGHLESSDHKDNRKEMAAGDLLIGSCDTSSIRRSTKSSNGLPGLLNKSGMRSFWGRDVERMPDLLWARLRSGCYLRAMVPGFGKVGKKLYVGDVTDIHLGSVRYSGQGKYDPSRDSCVLWEDTPGSLDGEQHFERLIDPQDQSKAQLMGDSSRGWWPVCTVSWRNEHIDMSFRGSSNAYIQHRLGGLTITWVICWYQLFDGDWELVLWAVCIQPVGRL
jgi:hypothetical protein